MYYVYILWSENWQRFYVGSTGDLADREERHNSGRSKATKGGIPWVLVHSESFATRAEAVRREREIKAWKKLDKADKRAVLAEAELRLLQLAATGRRKKR